LRNETSKYPELYPEGNLPNRKKNSMYRARKRARILEDRKKAELEARIDEHKRKNTGRPENEARFGRLPETAGRGNQGKGK